MAELPNLAGVATRDLVETIGTERFKAPYINWSRTMNLMREHAPGWLVDYVPNAEGGLLHKAPIGGYVLIRFLNMETQQLTPALPQAVMDNRNKSIPCDKIQARDITDTQRRGFCMAAAMHFGLAYELWAKMPMENGYTQSAESAPDVAKTVTKEVNEEMFREQALEKGVDTTAIDALVGIVKGKLGNDFNKGLKSLTLQTSEELNKKYGTSQQEDTGKGW